MSWKRVVHVVYVPFTRVLMSSTFVRHPRGKRLLQVFLLRGIFRTATDILVVRDSLCQGTKIHSGFCQGSIAARPQVLPKVIRYCDERT